MERSTELESVLDAWKAPVLPLHHDRMELMMRFKLMVSSLPLRCLITWPHQHMEPPVGYDPTISRLQGGCLFRLGYRGIMTVYQSSSLSSSFTTSKYCSSNSSLRMKTTSFLSELCSDHS